MPLTHTTAFKIRHYECDAYGHVNHANYLRYMQEAAFEASAAAGYDFSRYDALGSLWLVRDTDVEYLRPLRYGDTVVVTTWVADFQRVRSRRAYELRRDSDGEVVARAVTDWAYLDAASGRPARIPPAMVERFMAGGPAPWSTLPPRARFPEPPPPPPQPVIAHRVVEWRDLDPLRHVNNAVYLAYMEEAGVAAPPAFGWPLERLIEQGVGIFMRRVRVEYREPALLGDELAISTYLSGVRNASGLRHYAITRPADGALLARGLAQWAFVDLRTGQPRRAPQGMVEDFAGHISAG
ncbi:MAG: hypothetical protein Kow00124_20340 [Anaerolineae bacterium]